MSNATEVLTLIEFLLARIAEDEARARGAQAQGPSNWSCPDEHGHTLNVGLIVGGTLNVGGPAEWTVMREPSIYQHYAAAHIAHHDPARVLAECEAKRRIVGLHKVLLVESDGRLLDGGQGPHGVEPECAVCGLNGVFTTAATGACETVALLAAVYADHPDYRDEWTI